MKYQDALSYLNSLGEERIKYGLSNIVKVLDDIDNPQSNYRIIHVTGSNGKGSVCTMTSYILNAAGYKVGTFTSPHITRINERIQINNKYISDYDFTELLNYVISTKVKLSYFETLTVMALIHFKNKSVDFAVLECGLGGRLDATNVVNSEIAVITNIGLEHTKILGNSIEKITTEKAEIIKKGSTVITGADCIDIIKVKCQDQNAILIKSTESNLACRMAGEFQRSNAGIAVDIARQLKIHDIYIKKGLMHAYIPGRFEFVSKNLLVDCAHNVHAVKILVKELKNLNRNLIIVLGLQKDKKFNQIFDLLAPISKQIILTQSFYKGSLNPDKIRNNCSHCTIIHNPFEALEYAKSVQGNDLIVITGSMYLISALQKALYII